MIHYKVDSIEGIWNKGREKEENGSPNLGYKIRHKEGISRSPRRQADRHPQ